ncbi:MAG TPA: phage holin family protein [Candidatus Paceibacterota bacterium]|nr:phage holin family protein [Candidatus Paceibacterota bacterium]
MRFLARLIITALSLVLVTYVVPGFEVSGFYPALIAALVLGILNAIVRPVLIVLTLPITILTLGLFIFVINAALFLFAASFIQGFAIASFGAALLGSILVSAISWVANHFID